jgi:hypothetical protein
MARERLETQAQEKSAKRGVHSREPSICIFLSCGASYYKITARYGGVKPTVLLKGRRKKKTRTRTRANTNPNGKEANSVDRTVRACVARESKREKG